MQVNGGLKELPGKFSTRARKADRIRIETPGGGFKGT